MRDIDVREIGSNDLGACYSVMRQLRPHLDSQSSFVDQVERQMKAGYRLMAASQGDGIVGLVGFRSLENLVYGRFIYVDDLVVAEQDRSGGLGARLLDAVASEARATSVPLIVLDTGLENARAQRFYFRYGMLSRAMGFKMEVAP